MPQETLAGTEISWSVTGDGPVTLFLHCALGSARGWQPLISHLPGRCCVTFDMPGHGRSGPWDPARDDHSHVLEVAQALLARFDWPVDLVGHSYGATVALRLALEAPARVRRLVLAEPVLFAAARLSNPEALRAFEVECAAETAAFAAEDWACAAALFLARWGGAPWSRLSPAQQADAIARIPMIPRSNRTMLADQFGLVPRLGQVRCPALLLSGAQSPAIIPAIQAGLAASLPKATAHVIQGAGHMLPLTHAAEIAPLLERFLTAESYSPSGSIR
ncbi:alpha/beta fold hydrolase [Dinoroseobacter sp. S375]|uniref:alpha/beta fold hydrolase n=1 Tax=Dinoroseobacter sp. S375 TaxID=3415136 RepID=UPI003C7B1358